ncbi:hypothetical protein BH09PSE1_BH09PSE1_24650 [soil metagenome]
MKRSLMVFTAISAFVLPALAPVATLAQDQDDRAAARESRHNRERPAETSSNDASAYQRPERAAEPQRDRSDDNRGQNRGNGGGGGRSDDDRGGSRPDRPQAPAPQPQPDRSGGSDGRDRGNRPDRGDNGGGGSGGWNGNTGWNGANQGRPGQGRPDQGRPDQGRPGQDRPGQDRPGQDRPDRPGNGNGNGNGGWNGNGQHRPGNDWNNGGDRGRDRDRQRNEYRRNFDSGRWQQNWNRNHRSDWWRNDNRFRGWSGVRFGFYFAPGYGYYSVPRSYYGHQYYVGDYLPSIFWRYSVNDYRTYGLGYPPEGTRWVYVDNAIYLIDEYDGYIIDVIRDAWRW